MRRELPKTFWLLTCTVLIAGNVTVYKTILPHHELKVTVMEVGSPEKGGRAVLMQSPIGKTLLIDTGPDASILRALGESLPIWQKNIDAVILTSSAARSTGGLPAVQSRYRISKIVPIGNISTPYGSSFVFDNSTVTILAPAVVTISSDSSVFQISSSTPAEKYIFK